MALTFLGARFSESGLVPADTMGAVGPLQFLLGVNGLIRTFTKSGAADGVLDTSLDGFFAPVAGTGVATTPRVRYDRLSGRWFVTATGAVDHSTGPLQPANRVLLAVSGGATITSASTFTFFAFQQDAVAPLGADAGCFMDSGTLAADASAVYVGGDFYCPLVIDGKTQANYEDSGAFVIRKSSVLGAGPIVVTAFRALASGGIRGPFAPQGADNDDPSATTGYLVGTDVTRSGLKLIRVMDPGGTPSISATIDVPVASEAAASFVPHKGETRGPLFADDGRLTNAVVRSGQLWTAHTTRADSTGTGTSSGDRNAVRWSQVGNLDTTPAISQFGTVFDNRMTTDPNSWFVPSVNVSRQGHVAIGGTMAGNGTFLSAWTAGRLAGDAPGTTGTPLVYAAGVDAYNPPALSPDGVDRWGPYSFTSVDPNDGMTMWTIQEYANAINSWGVSVARLTAPPPATPASVVPASVPVGLPSVNVRVTGGLAAASGFFDPGPGFASRIGASVSGGVAVNSVRYDSPTSIVLNLNTVAASPGAHDVTVTNPDGQAATGGGILTLTPAEGLLRVTTDPALPSQLSVDGSPNDSWGLNWLSLAAGTYNLSANHVEGFTEPGVQRVTVTAGSTTTVQLHFDRRGELRVVTSPAVPAPISVDGTTRDDWGMFTDLPTGPHQVCFGPAAGFNPPSPACQTVTLTAGQISTITGTYTSNPQAPGPQGTGLLRVTTPALPSQILVNGVPMDTFGLNWVDLPPGQYQLSFTHVEGFTEPPPQVVTVTAGATTTVNGFFAQRGELQVRTSPAVPATITVDGVPRDSFGLFTDLPEGTHTVCFGWAPGEVAPPCQAVTVSAVMPATITGRYTAGP